MASGDSILTSYSKKRLAFFSAETIFDDTSKISVLDNSEIYISISNDNIAGDNRGYIPDENSNHVAYRGVDYSSPDMIVEVPNDGLLKTARAFFVQKGIKTSGGYFSSFITDALTEGPDPFLFEDYDEDGGWKVYARSSLFSNYLGLEFKNVIYQSGFSIRYANIYRYQSVAEYIESTIDNYVLRQSFYFKISDFISADTKDTYDNQIYGSGDAFNGELTIRGHKWFGAASLLEIDPGGDDSDVYQHGSSFTFYTRSPINFHMRSNQKFVTEKGTQGFYSFLPYVKDVNSWAVMGSNEAEMHESTKLNRGYSVRTSIKQYIGYDNKAPYKSNSFTTRLRSSDKRISGSFFNAFRVFKGNQYQDYDEQYGPIIGIYNLYNHLVSVQHDAINMHYTQEQAGGEYDIGLGSAAKFLNEKVFMKATYGAQSRDHVMQTAEFIYGVDIKNLIFWKIGTGSTPEGKQVIGIHNLTKSKGNEKFLTNTLQGLKDKITDINIGHDETNKEVLFTLTYIGNPDDPDSPIDPVEDPSTPAISSSESTITIVFSERFDVFTGMYSMPSNFYTTFINQLISFNDAKAFIHKLDSQQLNIFGVDYPMILSYIATGGSKEASPMVKKFFEAIRLRTPSRKLVKIEFSTDSQSGSLDPFYDKDRFWLQPKYNEYHWEAPIPLSKDKGVIFDEGSEMKGEWLKVTLEYKGQAEFYVVYATTLFNPINY